MFNVMLLALVAGGVIRANGCGSSSAAAASGNSAATNVYASAYQSLAWQWVPR